MKEGTIAYITRSLVDASGISMWKGLKEECRVNNVPLITFRGPLYNKGHGSIIYDLINDGMFKGLVSWAATAATDDVESYHRRFTKTNLATLTFKIPGFNVISADCKSGMMQLVDHLIDVHGFTKIAFIPGPENHKYAVDRLEGYKESLRKHGINLDEKLITENGGWGIPDGAKGVQELFNRQLFIGRDIEAIVCVGDNVAIGAQEYLIDKGFVIPADVAVCGFNGTFAAQCTNPPLTTVQMPFTQIGKKAFELVSGDKSFEAHDVGLSSILEVAQSCGCKSQTVLNAETSGIVRKNVPGRRYVLGEVTKTLRDKTWQEQVINALLSDIKNRSDTNNEINAFFEENIRSVIVSYAESLCGLVSVNSTFITQVSSLLSRFISISDHFVIWQDFLSKLCKAGSGCIAESVYATVSDNIISQARVLVHEFDMRYRKQKSALEVRRESELRLISASLLASYDMNVLLDILTSSLKKLEIPGVYVVLYENCTYTSENKQIPEKSRLVLAVRHNQRIRLMEDDGIVFDTSEIIPEEYLPQENYYSLIVESLHFQDSYLGYIVFAEGPEEGGAYVAIRDQLSSSLYGALLLKKLENSHDEVQQTLKNMGAKADIVSHNSDEVNDSIATISSTMNSVTSSIKGISGDIQNVGKIVNETSSMITNVNNSITVLAESTEEISKSINMINHITETTNVLALNAAIEAAHAGEAGRGFSVVATEVKKLAAQTVDATAQILEMVSQNTEDVKDAQKLIVRANESMKKIASLSDSIQSSIEEQVSSSENISTQLENATFNTDGISKAIDEIARLGNSIN